MKVRRYYKKGVKYPYTISEEYLQKLKDERGEDEAFRLDNANSDLILDESEEATWFNDCCDRVIANPRWYLDNIDKIPTFKVNITRLFPKKKF